MVEQRPLTTNDKVYQSPGCALRTAYKYFSLPQTFEKYLMKKKGTEKNKQKKSKSLDQ
jgi:hypothetical protein